MLRKILQLGMLCISMQSFAAVTESQAAHQTPYPCENGTILTYFKRPTVITSTCPVPYGQFSLESGVQFNEYFDKGEGWVYPQIKTRIGLPWRSELAILLPSEISNSRTQKMGLLPMALALKHNLGFNEYWNSAVRFIYIPASGSKHFGTTTDGYVLNGIAAYGTKTFNLTLMVGASSLGSSKINGGRRYTTFSPDVTLGWYAKNWLELYAEVYGQTRTEIDLKPGYNLNTGLLFLLNKYMAADVEIGKRISGRLANINTYYGAGISFLL